MHLARTLLMALTALCLVVFTAGMPRASAQAHTHQSAAVQSYGHADTHVHAAGTAAHDHGHQHGAAPADVTPDAKAAASHDCAGDAAKGGAKCCGFACHAVTPVHQVVFGVSEHRLMLPRMPQDEQVGDSTPSSLERPPRLG